MQHSIFNVWRNSVLTVILTLTTVLLSTLTWRRHDLLCDWPFAREISTGGFPLQMVSNAELNVFFIVSMDILSEKNSRVTVDLRRHGAHVMLLSWKVLFMVNMMYYQNVAEVNSLKLSLWNIQRSSQGPISVGRGNGKITHICVMNFTWRSLSKQASLSLSSLDVDWTPSWSTRNSFRFLFYECSLRRYCGSSTVLSLHR